jgi:mono/diheme cytochrome c family protein
MTRIVSTALLAALAIACGGKGSGEPTTPAGDNTAPAGDNTAPAGDNTANPCGDTTAAPAAADPALVARGAKVFEDSCSLCHGDDGMGNKKTPAVKGPGSLAKYGTDDSLLAYTKKEMPKDDPGGLSEDDYRAVVAWMRAP